MAQSGTNVYSGRFDYTVDDKNRLTIPALWRWVHTDTEQFLAMPHPDGYIAVLPPARITKLLADISGLKISDTEAQAVKMRIFGEAHSFTFDKQGRFGLTQSLLDHASITRNAVLKGNGDTFNILCPAKAEEIDRSTKGESFGQMMRRVGL